MAGKADVEAHLSERRPALVDWFEEWNDDTPTASDRTSQLSRYLESLHLGEITRVGKGNSLLMSPSVPNPRRSNVLVVGRHNVGDLQPAAPHDVDGGLTGPGAASRVGPLMAFAEGACAAAARTADDPLNVTFLSLGDGDRLLDVSSLLSGRSFGAAFMTSATAWSPHYPTLSTGARGRLIVELELAAGASTPDFVTSGAVRNPLTTMTQLLGSLRNNKGQITIPGFYDRAQRPDLDLRATFGSAASDLDAWVHDLGVARPQGSLTSSERASMWPGISVLAIESPATSNAHTPQQTTARLAVYLVPDQRYIELEQALRAWFLTSAPADLNPTMRVLASTRPFRGLADSRAIKAQRRAAQRLLGREPVLVPAGGPPGSGELAFAVAAPLGFAGVAPPVYANQSSTETLPWSYFEAGVRLAAETCLQLRRP